MNHLITKYTKNKMDLIQKLYNQIQQKNCHKNIQLNLHKQHEQNVNKYELSFKIQEKKKQKTKNHKKKWKKIQHLTHKTILNSTK